MTTQDTIQRRADGSIDTAFYMARGHKMRSEAAHALAKGSVETAKGDSAGLLAALRRFLARKDALATTQS